jgi:hypothetical protein
MRYSTKTFLVGSFIVLGILVTGFVVADYFAVFGFVHKDGAKTVPFRFRIVDANTGQPLSKMVIQCIAPNENIKLLQYEQSPDPKGTIHGMALVPMGWESTILFHKFPRFPEGKKDLTFRFESPGYQSENRNISLNAIGEGIIEIKLRAQSPQKDNLN